MGVVGAFALRPCQNSVPKLPRHLLPLSAEDCIVTRRRVVCMKLRVQSAGCSMKLAT